MWMMSLAPLSARAVSSTQTVQTRAGVLGSQQERGWTLPAGMMLWVTCRRCCCPAEDAWISFWRLTTLNTCDAWVVLHSRASGSSQMLASTCRCHKEDSTCISCSKVNPYYVLPAAAGIVCCPESAPSPYLAVTLPRSFISFP